MGSLLTSVLCLLRAQHAMSNTGIGNPGLLACPKAQIQPHCI